MNSDHWPNIPFFSVLPDDFSVGYLQGVYVLLYFSKKSCYSYFSWLLSWRYKYWMRECFLEMNVLGKLVLKMRSKLKSSENRKHKILTWGGTRTLAITFDHLPLFTSKCDFSNHYIWRGWIEEGPIPGYLVRVLCKREPLFNSQVK